MSDTAIPVEWSRFADAVDGRISRTKATRFNPDHTFRIETNEGEVCLSWAVMPERGKGSHVKRETVFSFLLRPGSTAYLNVYPRDAMGNLLSMFNKNRRRSGHPELDREYIIVANEEVPFSAVVDKLHRFYQQNSLKSFVVNTIDGDGTKLLKVQVNELLTNEQELLFFYQFARDLTVVIKESL